MSVYSSPALDDYNYSVPPDHTGYSPPIAVQVAASHLPITVPAAAAAGSIELFAYNNDRNLQLLLPMTVSVTCKSPGPCALPPPPPAPPTIKDNPGEQIPGPAKPDDPQVRPAPFASRC